MQTIWDVNDQKYVGDSQDNKIITCCFQVQQKHQNMVSEKKFVNCAYFFLLGSFNK